MGVKPEEIARAIAGGNKVLAQLQKVCPRPREERVKFTVLDSSAPPYSEQALHKRIRQSTKPLLNKLETEWFNICKSSYPEDCQVLAQAIRFRLGNGIWFKPDVIVLAGATYAYEVKGPHAFRGGFENLKVAAGLYPKIRWTLVWKENGRWLEQEILP